METILNAMGKRSEMDPQEVIRASLGQRYKDLPIRERFGEWPMDERQQGIQRLIEEYTKPNEPPPIERSWPAGFIRI